jgi:endonuclease YncB( thermonuclease family)
MPADKVTRVLSGDSFRIANNIVRLEGVRAPEQATSESRLAKEKLESLILGKVVRYKVKARDGYGRVISQVWLRNVNVNRAMKFLLP